MTCCMLLLQFINTVFTTVGFGDIHAVSTAERAYTVIIMYVGTLIFGTLLSEVDMAVAHLRRFARAKADVMQKVCIAFVCAHLWGGER